MPIPKSLYCFMDEAGTHDNSNLACMSLILTEDPDSLRRACSELIEDIQHHPQMSNLIPSIRDNGIRYFHYCDDDYEVRNKFIEQLKSTHFDAYLVFARRNEINAATDDKTLQLRLFSTLLMPRIQESYYDNLHVVYERFNEGSLAVEEVYRSEANRLHDLISGNVPGPMGTIDMMFDNKSELCLSIADYICAVFSAYVINGKSLQSSAIPYQTRHFNSISGKYRLIHDYARGKYYSRQGEAFCIQAFLA